VSKRLLVVIFLVAVAAPLTSFDAVDAAKAEIGRPYRWGAAGPDAFDCSGLVRYSYQQIGVSLDNARFSTGTQNLVADTNRIDGPTDLPSLLNSGLLKRGDLLFFATDAPGQVSHVGVFETGSTMIHAPEPGQNVKEADLSLNYWRTNFLFATRVGHLPLSCSFTLSIASSIDGYPSGGSFPVTVTTDNSCTWSVASSASWIHVPAGAFTGTSTFSFVVEANPGASRSASITIAGNNVSINQTAINTPVPPTGGALTGSWNGSAVATAPPGSTLAPATFTMTLQQTDTSISGTWRLSGSVGANGIVAGSVQGASLSLSLNSPPGTQLPEYTCVCSSTGCPDLLMSGSVSGVSAISGDIFPPPGSNIYGTCNARWGFLRLRGTLTK
jgi:hypothetical protein